MSTITVMSITLQDFIFPMSVYFAKKLYLDKTKRFREIVKVLDEVAYVRFASVYRNFREAADFENVLDELSDKVAEE